MKQDAPEKCSICGDDEPFHVHNNGKRIENYFTVGRGMSDLEAAKTWKRRTLLLLRERKSIANEIEQIKSNLDSIEAHMAWLIRADRRFRVGQRVEFSQKARRANIVQKTKLSRKGTIKSIDAFSIVVQLDGQKRRRNFHHAFFNPVSGPKLF